MTEPLLVEPSGAVTVLRMTGIPRRGNPLSRDLSIRLLDALRAAEDDAAVRCVVLAGTEDYFSVGADIREFHEYKAAEAVLARWLDDLDCIRACRKPVVAAVRGHAVGGGFELALLCDLIVASETAQFSLPETGIGVIAGGGGTQRLLALCGRAIATDLILTGRVLSGTEAGAMGIAARVAPHETVLSEAIQVAEAIAARSPEAVRFAREVLYEASEGPIRQSLRIERLLASLVLDTEERQRRTTEFLAGKRK